ncbi:hypothetical protein PT974_06188 [Cladobotryum mycophilum]|uniref:Alcohol dehydrogenase-like N-terminal domain-containing protein n=1 Tax=Cladobotryum mycophilum TaxID=491253 RepID=A0ABR0SKV2_9HYPO
MVKRHLHQILDLTYDIVKPQELAEMAEINSKASQTVLLLHGPRQPYQTTPSFEIPRLVDDRETLIKTYTIGLNPIDWKAPGALASDFNFGIATLPYIAGRELAGKVVELPRGSSRLRRGDRTLVISTDYRDLRKAAYQEYVVSSDFNQAAGLGVAFVAAAITLGICMGVDFSTVLDGPDLLQLVSSIDPEGIPQDVRSECLHGIVPGERAVAGDWVAIWGGSSTSANMTAQLARLVGLRVITIVDTAKHGLRISNCDSQRPDLLVDSHDPSRVIDIINANVGGQLRFALDTTGRDSAAVLLKALTHQRLVDVPPSPPIRPAGA